MEVEETASGKRILVISQHFWPENFRLNDICDFFIEQGCEVDVLCGIPNYPKGRFFDGYSYFRNRKQRHKGVKIRRVFEIPRKNNTNIQIFLNYVSFPVASLFHIPRLLTKHYDKIFLYQTSPVIMTTAGLIVGKIKKIETTMYVLDLWPENLFSILNVKHQIFRRLATGVSHWHYKKVDKLIALSEKMKDRLVSISGVPSDKIVVLPHACEKIYETNIYDKTLSSRFKTGFNIVFAGNISPAQSFETIIEAAKKLKADKITDINWIIVGDGMSRKWLEKEAGKAKLTDNFYFEGIKPMEDIPKYTTIADCLIGCLIKSDLLEATIPAKVLSYIASGKPTVLAMDGEVQGLVNNTIRCGYAGSTEDSDALANNIRKIYDMPAKDRRRMGARGRAYHLEHFERNIILTKMYRFIFNLRSKV